MQILQGTRKVSWNEGHWRDCDNKNDVSGLYYVCHGEELGVVKMTMCLLGAYSSSVRRRMPSVAEYGSRRAGENW